MSEVCFECGSPAEYSHHVVPKSKGGTKTVSLCGSCHGKAHHRNKAMNTATLTKEALKLKKSKNERTGHIPFGKRLTYDGKHLEPFQEEIEILTIIKSLKKDGKSLREIAAHLNNCGFKNRGNTWNHVSVSRVSMKKL